MNIKGNILDNLSQIYAIVEKETKLQLRIKTNLILSYIMPIISLIIPLIIMGQIFTLAEAFGPWNSQNFFIFMLSTYQITLLNRLTSAFSNNLLREKAWRTLPALIIAPFNRFNLLFGIFFSHLVVISIPFAIFIIICYIYYPISILTILSVLTLYFFLALFFSGIGLVIGVFAISKESVVRILNVFYSIAVWFSCLSMPFEFFPGFFRNIVIYNPLFYNFVIIRLVWIEDNIVFSLLNHGFNFFVLIGTGLVVSIMGVFFFNYIYKKYGIAGY
ncbi:MAG: ABC transporter permease [Candidatus Lokiarchaeia archaeon]